MVVSRRTEASSITPSAISRSSSARSSPSRSSSRTCRSIATRSSSGTLWRASHARPRPSKRSACGHFAIRCAARIAWDLVLEPRPVADDLVASRHQPAHPLGGGVRRPDLRQVACGVEVRQRACVDLVGLHVGMGDGLHLKRVGDHHPRHEGRLNPRHRHGVAGGLDDDLVRGLEALAEALQRRAGHLDPPGVPQHAPFPDHHLPEGPVDVDADSRVACAPPVQSDGSGGRHDTYGSARSAQPGEPQRRPATNASSKLVEWTGLPAPSYSRSLCPGCSQHTPQLREAAARRRPRRPHTGCQCHRGAELEAAPRRAGPRALPL